MRRNTPEDGLAALQILDALYEIAERTYNTRYKLEILAAHALGLAALGKISQADAALRQAVDLSRLGGFLRVFADMGRPMREMLHRLARQGYSVETIRRILAAFPEDDKNSVRSESPAQARRYPTITRMPEVESLTPREIEVLTLLREPLSIKEIANKLYISYPTVKRHTINLYSKLGVNRRWDAVAKAEELKILLPH
jgi:LuxR family maltose regulon positive regulatory protein